MMLIILNFIKNILKLKNKICHIYLQWQWKWNILTLLVNILYLHKIWKYLDILLYFDEIHKHSKFMWIIFNELIFQLEYKILNKIYDN